MNDNTEFSSKWSQALKGARQEEQSIFVPQGDKPKTQRQFVLYHQFDYIGKIAKKYNVQHALEIGCGRGTMSLYLNKYLGVKVTATDISNEAIVLAKENFHLHNGTGDIIVADAATLPFPDGSFDMTVSIGLLEHLEDYSALLREQYRVLNKGGVIISLNIPKKQSIQILNTLYRFFLAFFVPTEPLKKDYFRNNHTPDQYKKEAELAGFKNVETFYSNSFPLFTPVGRRTERVFAWIYERLYRIRGVFMKYPFKGSRVLSQEHFLVGIK